MKKLKYYPVRDIENLKEMLETSCKIYNEKTAYLTKEFGTKEYQEIKYKKLIEDVNNLGTALINRGLKGKKIAVIGENRYNWACSYLATICGTGIVVPLDRLLPKQEIVRCLERAEVSAVIYSDKLKETIEEIAKENSSIEMFIGMDRKESEGKFISYSELLEEGKRLQEQGNRDFLDAKINIDNLELYVKEFMKSVPLNKYDLKYMPYVYICQLLRSTYGYKEIYKKDNNDILEFAHFRTKLCKNIYENCEEMSKRLEDLV